MIKLPKEVSKIIKIAEDKGFEIYAVGGCVRDSLLGNTPLDWDLTINASIDQMKEMYPEAKVISEKYAVVRFDYADSENPDGAIIDLAAMRVDGTYSDHRRPDDVTFTDKIEEDLARRDFTINAMADNPSKPIVDIYDGREDLKKKLIRTVGDPKVRFEEDPLRILRAIRFAAEFDFDLHKPTYEAIVEKVALVGTLSKERIRGEFTKIISAPFAGKGLKMILNCGLLPYIIGEKTASKLRRVELREFTTLAEGIDKTKCVEERRLGLFYTCMENKRADAAIDYLNYGNKMRQQLIDGVHFLIPLYFMANKEELKDFLAMHGLERYEYVHNLSKARAIAFDSPNIKIKNRIYFYKEIMANKEPVYIEDLAITGEDLIEQGIASGEQVGRILLSLTDVVHRKPLENNREDLLKLARKFAKNKAAMALRKVKWLR